MWLTKKRGEKDCEKEKKRLREKFYDVTWTSIYFEGTKLFVEIKENKDTDSCNNSQNFYIKN